MTAGVSAGDQVAYVMHEGILTHDAERCKQFYTTALGLEVLPRPAFKSHGYWLGTPGRFPQIHITIPTATPWSSSRRREKHRPALMKGCSPAIPSVMLL